MMLANAVRDLRLMRRAMPWSARLRCWLFSMLLVAAPACLLAQVNALPVFAGSLKALAGDVSWYDRDSGGWIGNTQQVLRNWPLAAGDRLRTGPDGRAELHLGSSTVRLGADVELTLQRLDEQGLVIWLQSGSLALRLTDPLPGSHPSVELTTLEGRWLPTSPGHYRFDRQPKANTPATQASVWRGELRFVGRDSAMTIPAGRRADLWLDPVNRVTRYAWAPVDRDVFADWVARDERLDDAPSAARHVPPAMSGWQDLDRHGDWVVHPEYGEVWQPRAVAPGWAPFHDGRWVWVAPWGWTWIDAAPWGFAPFHYGSWVTWQGRWCWSPGQSNHPVRYAPAHSGWIVAPAPGPHIGYRPPPPRVVIPIILNPPPRRVAPEPTRPLAPHEFDRWRDPNPRERWWHDGREPSRPAPDRPVLRPGPVAPPVLAPVVKVPAEPDRRDRVEPRPSLPAPTPAVSPVPFVSPAPSVLPPPQVPPVQVAPRPGLSPGLNAPVPLVRLRDAAKAQEPAQVATPQRPGRAESR
ncbi:MAG: hypothetical protein EBY28_05555 [Betaproteobacteria bacterium]|nr:hypothetical protein [Betaproteobacteria bacterium]